MKKLSFLDKLFETSGYVKARLPLFSKKKAAFMVYSRVFKMIPGNIKEKVILEQIKNSDTIEKYHANLKKLNEIIHSMQKNNRDDLYTKFNVSRNDRRLSKVYYNHVIDRRKLFLKTETYEMGDDMFNNGGSDSERGFSSTSSSSESDSEEDKVKLGED